MSTQSEQIAQLEAEAARLAQQGRLEQAQPLWERVAQLDPRNTRVTIALGQYHFRKGDYQVARTWLQRVVDMDGSDCQQWVNLALACQMLKDETAEEAAIRGALRTDPNDLLALILRANLLERQGRMHQAARVYGSVTASSPTLDRLNPNLRPAVAHAMQFREKYERDFGNFIDEFLSPVYAEHGTQDLRRFQESVDIMVGRKRRFDSQPANYYFPHLAPIEFFDRKEFPWLERLEGATEQILAEFLQVLDTEEGFTPYLTYPDDVPHFQFTELNNSPRWSAFHLYEAGRRNEANAARCPATVAMLDSLPQPRQSRRTPTAMFSLLKPKTRIPPHTGVTNVRLLTHLPLIVPESCGFRVGNQTREWVPGQAFVFDDTIEHEAWNDSDKLRVVMIFDVWHPHLTPAERALITAMSDATNAFSAEDENFSA